MKKQKTNKQKTLEEETEEGLKSSLNKELSRRLSTRPTKSKHFWFCRRLPGSESKGALANCLSSRYPGRMCSRRSRISHGKRHIIFLTRDLDTFKMTIVARKCFYGLLFFTTSG